MSLIVNLDDLLSNEPSAVFKVSEGVKIREPSIHGMPDEVLLKIFKLILLDYERDATFNTIFRSSHSRVESISVLLTLSRVCKAWQAVISAYPGFWTRADGRHKQLLTDILARSGELPLSLFVTSETKGLLELLASYGRRIKRLDITVRQGTGGFEGLPFVPGRSLECFTLNYEDFSSGLERVLPFFLFDEEILPLKALSITPFAGYFPANRFPNLTHLQLVLRAVRDGADDFPQPLSSSFFDLLSNTPMLEFLSVAGIGDPFEGFSGMPVSPNMPVALANLRSLVFMAGGLKTMGMVLERLSIPQTALVRLQAVLVPSPDASPLPKLGIVQSIDRLHLATEQACLQLIAEGPFSGLWLQGLIADKDPADEDEDDGWNWRGWLSMLPDFLPLAQITKLEVYVGSHHAILTTLLPHMVGVVELSLRLNGDDEQLGGDPDLSLARLLYQAFAEDSPLLCPNLRVFSIDVDGYHPTAVPDLYPEEMKRMLIFRSRMGQPLDCVVIQPFADIHMVQPALYDDVASRFDTLRMVIQDLDIRGPGIPAIPHENDAIWGRWSVEGADKYWILDWHDQVAYTTAWDC